MLTSKDHDFIWSTAAQEDFEKLKATLIQEPILKQETPERRYAIEVRPMRYLGTEPTLEPIWNQERLRGSKQEDPAVREIIGNILKNNSRDYYPDLDGVVYQKSGDS
ncbi:hypothetical protein JTB14_020593 [Gonioctena quinquepunctata]|nr:hypothetical protein JTB14_020593 [Gonioctena quinquepunctata]